MYRHLSIILFIANSIFVDCLSVTTALIICLFAFVMVFASVGIAVTEGTTRGNEAGDNGRSSDNYDGNRGGGSKESGWKKVKVSLQLFSCSGQIRFSIFSCA